MAQNLIFSKWICYGEGWATSHEGAAVITVTRAYGSDVVHVKIDWTYVAIAGDTAQITGHFLLGGADYSIVIASAGPHYAGGTYRATKEFDIAVGSTAGTLSGTAWISVDDPNATSGKNSAVLSWAQDYQSKGASTFADLPTKITGKETARVSVTRYVDGVTHRLAYSFNQSDWVSLTSNFTLSYTISGADTSAMANKLTNSRRGTVYLRVGTFLNGSQIGNWVIKGVPYEMAASDGLPVATASASLGTDNPTHRYISGLTPVVVTPGNTGNLMGASVNYAITFDGVTLNSQGEAVTFQPPSTEGTLSISVKAITSRGDADTKVISVRYWMYTPPEISVSLNFTATTLTATIKWAVKNIDGQNRPSAMSLQCTTGQTVQASTSRTLSGYSGTVTWNVPGTIDTSIQTYLITAAFSDTMGNSVTQSKSTGQLVMSLYRGGRGVALFKEADREGFDVSGDFYVNNVKVSEMVDFVVEEGSGGAENNGSTGAYYYRKWHSGKVELWARRTGTINFTGTWIAPLKNGTIVGNNVGYVAFSYPSIFTEAPKVFMHVSEASTPIWLVPSGTGTHEHSIGDWLITASNSNINNVTFAVDLYAVQI